MNGGDDSFSATGNLAALIQITVDGGTGNDTILGSNGNDVLTRRRRQRLHRRQPGQRRGLPGAGDDVFQWDPGDGSDTVEGQAGNDRMLFNGANINENIDISANGGRVRFTRNVGNIVMDLNGVEGINFNALGGADTITVNDLSGTDLVRGQPRPRRLPGAVATARPTPSSSTAPTRTTSSMSSVREPQLPWSGCQPW